MLFCMYCTISILIWTNLVPTFVSSSFAFSSAFNTIQPNLLAEKLLKMKLSIPGFLFIQLMTSVCWIWLCTFRHCAHKHCCPPVVCAVTFSFFTVHYCCRSSYKSCPIDVCRRYGIDRTDHEQRRLARLKGSCQMCWLAFDCWRIWKKRKDFAVFRCLFMSKFHSVISRTKK